ncbi:ABC transporter permease [Fusobacterium pseudoperiodonticum]|jgi:peptide ABC transporter, permease protein|uniref:ABC transporter permease n=1 Tax=Fusobacterium pseudoperiodonticum TaxID=2663009 RepID=UPI001CAC1247|nr:ABC transporter permease [Fusobacterium pseudoperiodonticum]MBF1201047.1 ABC transporter permease [Fusobacterium periodonticum]MBF1214813.1 ABC transporter permease [Fusobacterium periodonticum]MED5606034.1 ABC transporter permease [Fusobacterium pseudoperiodonticum]
MEKNIKDPVKAENPTGFSVIVREFKKDKLALFSFFAVTIFIIAVFVASMFINLQQLQTVDIFRKYEVPSFNNFWNFFGRDSGGRSVMGYVIVGARNSITIGVIITIVTTFIGLFVGLCMGYYGGKIDAWGMRIVDFISIMPSVMIIIVFVSIVPKYGIFQFILIFSMFYWTRTTRLARSKTLSETRRDYVNASKTMGTSDLKIMFSEILPNISSIIIVNGTLALASNIGIEVALSFLGFGLPAATPSLGTLISYASKPEIIQYKAYVWLPAALVLLFMMLGINYIGQALRRAADAKQRLG